MEMEQAQLDSITNQANVGSEKNCAMNSINFFEMEKSENEVL